MKTEDLSNIEAGDYVLEYSIDPRNGSVNIKQATQVAKRTPKRIEVGAYIYNVSDGRPIRGQRSRYRIAIPTKQELEDQLLIEDARQKIALAKENANKERRSKPDFIIASTLLACEEDQLMKFGINRLMQIAEWMADAGIVSRDYVADMANLIPNGPKGA